MDLEQARQQAQLAFLASGEEIELGRAEDGPLPPAQLATLAAHDPRVVEHIGSGLTAEVWRLRVAGRDWALKRERPEPRVHNVDGRTAFLNELQRRAEFERLRAEPGGDLRWRGIAATTWASLRGGLLVSPWIAGEAVVRWDERRLVQHFETGIAMLLAGLFDWDPSPGNLLDDGVQLRLFDFGYTYRFDPLRHFNSAGDGRSAPQFHLAERLETRNLSASWLALEEAGGDEAALDAFRTAKRVALDAYRRLEAALRSRGATAEVLAWVGAIAARWQAGLAGDLRALYREDAWRSHRLDVADDLAGRSCTPLTLRRIDWLARHACTEGPPIDLAALRREAEAALVSSIP